MHRRIGALADYAAEIVAVFLRFHLFRFLRAI